MGRSALANLLGGIGVWHGSLWMRSRQMLEANQVSPYGPFSLLSAVPSRTGFPRGFLWDEVGQKCQILLQEKK
jgi:mannosyl-oligosaccharide glucosidase